MPDGIVGDVLAPTPAIQDHQHHGTVVCMSVSLGTIALAPTWLPLNAPLAIVALLNAVSSILWLAQLSVDAPARARIREGHHVHWTT